jgi:hypothetical protein
MSLEYSVSRALGWGVDVIGRPAESMPNVPPAETEGAAVVAPKELARSVAEVEPAELAAGKVEEEARVLAVGPRWAGEEELERSAKVPGVFVNDLLVICELAGAEDNNLVEVP